ncbi:TetR/AcrR family transcriptional regulator [Nocardia sp. NPDC049526]|uniref:TetR/AcrR family transcriptional regulator n=1 Tax=Nocardia sp. NPDC049526 TaxID=3364316 RepID=UPI0037BDBAED
MTTDTELDSPGDPIGMAARDLFHTRGYVGTHIKDIAREAGVSVSTFYARFGSKEQAYRSVMGTEPPLGDPAEQILTGRAQRTREALIAAARECIERDGYQAARITSIADLAGVAVGSFYTYFPSKLEVFTEIIHRAVAELRQLAPEPLDKPITDDTDVRERVRERIRRAIEHYIDGYSRYAAIVLRIDEAVGAHPELIPMRLGGHRGFAQRIERSLRHWQELGIIDPELDPEHAAHALAAMVGHASRIWITYGEPHDRDTAIATLTRLWVNGIGLAQPE